MLLNKYIYSYFQIILCLLLAMVYGFSTPTRPYIPHATRVNTPGLTRQLVMILVDGMRKDFAFNPELMPNLVRLSKEGVSGTAQTEAFPITTVGIRAICSGTSYSSGDVINNLIKTGSPAKTFRVDIGDSIFKQAAEKGLRTVLSGQQIWPNTFGNSINTSALKSRLDYEYDQEVQQEALNFIKNNDFNILIIHYLGLDKTGHNFTPLSSQCRAKAAELDNYIGEIAKQINSTTTLFIFADHGMSNKGGHSYDDYGKLPIVTDAPFIFAKHAIGHKQNLSVNQIDFAPTLSLMLGISLPTYSEGVVVTDIFNIDKKEQALKVLENRQARIDNLKQIQKQKGIYFDFHPSVAQKEFDNNNFSQAIEIGKQEIKEINLLEKFKIQFHIPILTILFLILSPFSIILFYLSSTENISLVGLPKFSFTWLASSLIIIYILSYQLSSIEFFRSFLLSMFGWLICLTVTSAYKLFRLKNFSWKIILPVTGLAIFLLIFLTPTAVFFINLLVFISIVRLVFMGTKGNTALRLNLIIASLIISSLYWLGQIGAFSNNKPLRTVALCTGIVFFSYYFLSSDNRFRAFLTTILLIFGGLTSFKFIDRFSCISLIASGIFALAIFDFKRKQSPNKRIYFLESGLGLLIIWQIQRCFITPELIQKYNHSFQLNIVSILCICGILFGLYKYLIQMKGIHKINKIEFSMISIFISILTVSFMGRIMPGFYFRNILGQIVFLSTIIAITITSSIKLRDHIKIYIFYILILCLSVITFEPIHTLFILAVLFIGTHYTYKVMSICRKTSVIPYILYIVLSMLIYYSCYGSLSTTVLFEEARVSIIGAGILDYSNWNMAIIRPIA